MHWKYILLLRNGLFLWNKKYNPPPKFLFRFKAGTSRNNIQAHDCHKIVFELWEVTENENEAQCTLSDQR